jgi:PTH1 family peptidyl-tRNA hydrolase
MALDVVAESHAVGSEEDCCNGVLARCDELGLFKPLTFMNRSGPAVARLCAQEGVGSSDVLVLVDDLDLPLGALRLRPRGSPASHKGLISLVEALGTEEFPRLRIGIGPRPAEVDGRDFVLSPFEAGERAVVDQVTDVAAQAVQCWAGEGIEVAMNRFNRKLDIQQSPGKGTPPTGC